MTEAAGHDVALILCLRLAAMKGGGPLATGVGPIVTQWHVEWLKWAQGMSGRKW